MLGKLGELKKMRSQAMAMQKALAKEEVVVEEKGARIVMTGDQKVKELETNDASDKDLIDLINKAIKKSQEVAAKKLQEMSGGLTGLMGQ